MEKLLMEATLDVLEKGLVIGLQDMGAAGLISSSVEMASRAGNGLFMDLDKVPVRTENMTAYELLLSESQERMLMVVKPENWDALKVVLEKWQLAYGIIGEVTDTKKLKIVYKGIVEVDVPVGPLTDRAPKYNRPTTKEDNRLKRSEEKLFDFKSEATKEELISIYKQYDQDIGTKTVRGPRQGGAAVVRLREDGLGVAISTSCNERYCAISAKLGAAHAVLKSARMIAAVGGRPLAITDCMNYGNPEDPRVMGEFSDGIDGISLACDKLKIAVVSGNVSFYNETDGQSIAPTPMIGMVGKVDDVTKSPSALLDEENKFVAVLKPLSFAKFPEINWGAELEAIATLKNIISKFDVVAARDVGSSGIKHTINKMRGDYKTDPSVSGGNEEGAYILAFKTKESLESAREFVKKNCKFVSLENF
jgi:phosphoribosylformylglycinamidine synthase